MSLINNFVLTITLLVFVSSSCLTRTDAEIDGSHPGFDWIEIKAENFEVTLPDKLRKEGIVGMDGYAARFSNPYLTVSIESRAGSITQADRKRESRVIKFTQENMHRDGMVGVEAVFQFKDGETNFRDPGKHFVRMLSIDCKWSDESVTFTALFSDPKYDVTARKVLNSVKVVCSD